jgi:hypothetical protein
MESNQIEIELPAENVNTHPLSYWEVDDIHSLKRVYNFVNYFHAIPVQLHKPGQGIACIPIAHTNRDTGDKRKSEFKGITRGACFITAPCPHFGTTTTIVPGIDVTPDNVEGVLKDLRNFFLKYAFQVKYKEYYGTFLDPEIVNEFCQRDSKELYKFVPKATLHHESVVLLFKIRKSLRQILQNFYGQSTSKQTVEEAGEWLAREVAIIEPKPTVVRQILNYVLLNIV